MARVGLESNFNMTARDKIVEWSSSTYTRFGVPMRFTKNFITLEALSQGDRIVEMSEAGNWSMGVGKVVRTHVYVKGRHFYVINKRSSFHSAEHANYKQVEEIDLDKIFEEMFVYGICSLISPKPKRIVQSKTMRTGASLTFNTVQGPQDVEVSMSLADESIMLDSYYGHGCVPIGRVIVSVAGFIRVHVHVAELNEMVAKLVKFDFAP